MRCSTACIPGFRSGTNPDVLAFHEAFADIVALFQHFTMPESLLHQIRHTQGDLEQENLLGQLAVQFGDASGMHGALRSAIGAKDPKTGKWKKAQPKRTDYTASDEPHARGAVLVSAVFAAFVTIYRARSADLIRLATSGIGVSCRPERFRTISPSALPARPPRWRIRCSTCASGRSTIARRST